VPLVKTQGMAFGAERPQVSDPVRSVFSRVDMVNMPAKQGNFLSAVRSFPSAANPRDFPQLQPNCSRRTSAKRG